MKVEKVKETDGKIEFKLSNSNPAFANAIRRTAIAGVLTYAVDKVIFYENTSSLFDEYIAHRIGLVPLKTDYTLPPATEISLSIDKEGPAMVYSGDMKSSDRKISPASKKIPIMKIGPGQVLRVEAKARLGAGREHAKWQPGLCTYSCLKGKEGIDESTFMFKVETYGGLPPATIVLKAAEALQERCGAFLKELKSL